MNLRNHRANAVRNVLRFIARIGCRLCKIVRADIQDQQFRALIGKLTVIQTPQNVRRAVPAETDVHYAFVFEILFPDGLAVRRLPEMSDGVADEDHVGMFAESAFLTKLMALVPVVAVDFKTRNRGAGSFHDNSLVSD